MPKSKTRLATPIPSTFSIGDEVTLLVRRRRRFTVYVQRGLVTVVDVHYNNDTNPVFYTVSLGMGGTLQAVPSELRPGNPLDRIVQAIEDSR